MFNLRVSIAVTSLTAAGCASLDARRDLARSAAAIEQATGAPGESLMLGAAAAGARVAELIAGGLTADEAVQVCLLNNPRLHAEFLRIGMGRADLVQSGLLSNPSLSFAPRWPDGGGLSNLQLGIAQNIAELWQIPYRRQAAARDLDRVILDVAREATLLALRARLAYYRVVQVERERDIARENLELTQRLVHLTISRRDAGAGSDLDVAIAEAQHADARVRSQNVTLSVVQARADLVKLLGLDSPPDAISLVDTFPAPSPVEITAASLIVTARRMRLDWQSAKMAVQTAAARVEYEKSRVVNVLEVGVTAERNAQWDKSRGGGVSRNRSLDLNSDGSISRTTSYSRESPEPVRSEWVVGPTLGIDVPVFDQNQAQIAKAEYMLRQSQHLEDAIERDVTQGAYASAAQLAAAVENARLYRDEIVPLRERVLTLSQHAYRSGRTTFLAVLEAQRALLEARAGHADALKNYVSAIVEIEGVAGQPFDRLFETSAPTVTRPSSSSEANPQREDEAREIVP